jgi:branched-chain amino acid aminotransferase
VQNSLSSGAAWMNGKIIPITEASIPVTDWGLTHSDITYDVAPVWNGSFFRLDDYLNRFFESMNSLHLDPKMTKQQVQDALEEMVAASGMRESYVAMVCSRGVPRVAGSRDPRDCENHFYAWCVPYVYVIKPEIVDLGASATIAEGVTRISDASINPAVKNYHWGDFTKGIFEAKEKKFETVFLTDSEGFVTEGPGFNVFAIKDDALLTSKHGVLEGITRKTVLEIANKLELKSEIRKISKQEFLNADEVFISSSAGGIIPIIKIDNTVFANGTCGKYTKMIHDIYWEWFDSPKYRTPIDYTKHSTP